MEEILEQFTKVYEWMSDEKFTKALAKMYKGIYDGLIAEGFTKEEALTLLSRMNLGQNK